MATIDQYYKSPIEFTKLGIEDIFWGEGIQIVNRFGKDYEIHEVHLAPLIYENGKTLKEVITAGALPEEDKPQTAGHTTAKGRMLGSMGVLDDAAWSLALTTPSSIKADYTFPDDAEVNHLLVGPFSTTGFTMTVPTGITVTII